jgi:hypothetical protein
MDAADAALSPAGVEERLSRMASRRLMRIIEAGGDPDSAADDAEAAAEAEAAADEQGELGDVGVNPYGLQMPPGASPLPNNMPAAEGVVGRRGASLSFGAGTGLLPAAPAALASPLEGYHQGYAGAPGGDYYSPTLRSTSRDSRLRGAYAAAEGVQIDLSSVVNPFDFEGEADPEAAAIAAATVDPSAQARAYAHAHAHRHQQQQQQAASVGGNEGAASAYGYGYANDPPATTAAAAAAAVMATAATAANPMDYNVPGMRGSYFPLQQQQSQQRQQSYSQQVAAQYQYANNGEPTQPQYQYQQYQLHAQPEPQPQQQYAEDPRLAAYQAQLEAEEAERLRAAARKREIQLTSPAPRTIVGAIRGLFVAPDDPAARRPAPSYEAQRASITSMPRVAHKIMMAPASPPRPTSVGMRGLLGMSMTAVTQPQLKRDVVAPAAEAAVARSAMLSLALAPAPAAAAAAGASGHGQQRPVRKGRPQGAAGLGAQYATGVYRTAAATASAASTAAAARRRVHQQQLAEQRQQQQQLDPYASWQLRQQDAETSSVASAALNPLAQALAESSLRQVAPTGDLGGSARGPGAAGNNLNNASPMSSPAAAAAAVSPRGGVSTRMRVVDGPGASKRTVGGLLVVPLPSGPALTAAAATTLSPRARTGRAIASVRNPLGTAFGSS